MANMQGINGQIAILGAGAIGQLIHQQLATQINTTQAALKLIVSHERFEQANTNQQLSFTSLDGNSTNYHCQLIDIASNTLMQELAKVKLVIVCVKAYQVASALKPLLAHLPIDSHIMLLHNGMGPHLEVQSLLNSSSTLSANIGLSLATTSQAALKTNAFAIKQTGNGATSLGLFAGPQMDGSLLTLVSRAIPNLMITDNIVTALWTKLTINCAINPLTAIEQCQNGQLAAKQYQSQIAAIIDECVQVARADGVTLDAQQMTKNVAKVIELTAANYSSMHQDIAHQRQTEIDQINGYVVMRARSTDINTPVNQALVEQIHQLQAYYNAHN
ncbi:2-dehydropantoate 2-reductase [Shewanella maritima]|uniref:2-dehydropantoate 2-reductase n=1 Tax=Shewanella maritima TaxID=2520507 RepID=A0A411PFB9_9GAMM|nr:2-dehydropantoate 2-reductase [Shewanella maritima]QBF82296.1 2-dehydropantoate 2-reductase [Shewanella maritima]